MSRIANCEQELDSWVVGLPTPFRMNEQNPERGAAYATDALAYLVTLLHLRYHGIRNLIHRPVLERFLSVLGSSNDTLQTQPNDYNHALVSCQHSLHICATSSAKIIALANSFNHARVVPGMWWTTLYFGKL
jgi:hypothetical protein